MRHHGLLTARTRGSDPHMRYTWDANMGVLQSMGGHDTWSTYRAYGWVQLTVEQRDHGSIIAIRYTTILTPNLILDSTACWFTGPTFDSTGNPSLNRTPNPAPAGVLPEAPRLRCLLCDLRCGISAPRGSPFNTLECSPMPHSPKCGMWIGSSRATGGRSQGWCTVSYPGP